MPSNQSCPEVVSTPTPGSLEDSPEVCMLASPEPFAYAIVALLYYWKELRRVLTTHMKANHAWQTEHKTCFCQISWSGMHIITTTWPVWLKYVNNLNHCNRKTAYWYENLDHSVQGGLCATYWRGAKAQLLWQLWCLWIMHPASCFLLWEPGCTCNVTLISIGVQTWLTDHEAFLHRRLT